MPRVTGRTGVPAAVLGAGLLLLTATFGAALVHIIEYHLGLGGSGDWRTNALLMLRRCPLSGGLLVVVLCALGTAIALWRELRVLRLRHCRLTWAAARAGIKPATSYLPLPRRRGRLLHLLIPLLAVQLALYTLADHLWSMGVQMRMGGILMTMPVQGAAPVLPLHLMVAVGLAVLLWRLERRLTVLRSVIAIVHRLLRLLGPDAATVRISPGPAPRPRCA
ncbi:MAG: hypothetical protein ACRDIE_16945, partial [Chloroflexota bacterium]